MLAPTILMDLFPRERRARVMSTFYLAMPIGAALGAEPGRSDLAKQLRLALGLLHRRRARPARGASRPCSCPSRSEAAAKGSTPSGSGAREGRREPRRLSST